MKISKSHYSVCVGLLSIVFFFSTSTLRAQQTNQSNGLPYYQIPEYPASYSAGTVAARVVDGLGFRFYWATEGLRDSDLAYSPNDEARTILETIEHIYGLSLVIVNATTKTANKAGEREDLGYAELRKRTLLNIEKAANILRTCKDSDIEDFIVIFEGSSGTTEYPFWNNLNGPIADAIWHSGQVVSLRRSAGNPFNSNVSLLNGKLRN